MVTVRKYEMECEEENAAKMWDWIERRGGVARWKSIDLSRPAASLSTPATIRRGNCEGHENDKDKDTVIPYPKPAWYVENTPSLIVTNPDEIEVYKGEEVKRFHVAVRVSGNGLSLKCTDGSSARIRKEVEKAGQSAYQQFDYETQEAIIYRSTSIGSLKEWKEKQP